MIQKDNTAAVVVWYQPTQQQAEYIRQYADAVRHVYIVDNSDNDNSLLSRDIANATYIANGKNLGIATALNIGYKHAIEDDAQWIVSLDQDSRMTAEMMRDYLQYCAQCDIPDVGLFAPYPDYGNGLPTDDETYEIRESVITSGTLMSASIYRQTGPFRDAFFIDLVDDEYCLRVRRQKKQIVMVKRIVIKHHIGNGYIITPLLHHRFIEHNAFRYYYIVRNTLCLIAEYPEARTHYRQQLRRQIKRILLYPQPDKWTKLKMCIRGYRDFKHKNMNQYPSEPC